MKLFYVSNRTAEEDRHAQEPRAPRLPDGRQRRHVPDGAQNPDWGSAKGTRRAFVAKDFRVLLMLGDNFGDFTDAYRGSEAERLKAYEDNKARWAAWIMLANPAYGSFEVRAVRARLQEVGG